MGSTDRDALNNLYEATGGAGWVTKTNWGSSAPLSQWHGVAVNDQGRVVKLVLDSNSLEGVIPESLTALSELEELRFINNKLTGPIPEALCALKELKVLVLYKNQLNGCIPAELGDLSNLEHLSLCDNNLTGSIPRELGALSKLHTLQLYRNMLTGSIPKELFSLSRLETLWVNRNKLTGPIPPDIGNATALVSVKLHRNELSGHIPKELGALRKLEMLLLGYNRLVGFVPAQLVKLQSISSLELENNQLSGPVPCAIQLRVLQSALFSRGDELYEGDAIAAWSERFHLATVTGNAQSAECLKSVRSSIRTSVTSTMSTYSADMSTTSGTTSTLTKQEEAVASNMVKQLKPPRIPGARATGHNPDEDSDAPINTRMAALKAAAAAVAAENLAAISAVAARSEEVDQRSHRFDTPVTENTESAECLKSVESSIRSSITSVQSTYSPDMSTTWGTTSTSTSSASTSTKQEEAVPSNTVKQLKPPRIPGARAIGERPNEDSDAPINTRMAAISGFEGEVVAWSFGDGPDVLRNHDLDFELEVPDLGRNVPALIGLCSSSAEVVDGKQCLLHPVVRCLARNGERFDPNLCLRLPVGDEASTESGSDPESDDENADVAFRAYLESKFTVVTREDASSEWVPMDGTIKQAEGGVFVLEVAVPHFCDFALSQDINVSPGCVEVVPLPKLMGKARRSHFHFVNQGEESLVAHCWGTVKKTGFWDSLRFNLGGGATSAHAEFEGHRQRVDTGNGAVYSVEVPRRDPTNPENQVPRVFLGTESITVAWTTQRRQNARRRLAQVWGSSPMQHKHAMVFGPLLDIDTCQVSNLPVDDGESLGKLVKSKVE